MVFQPVLVVVLLEIAMLEVAYIGYGAYRAYTRSWNPLMLSLAVGSIFTVLSLGATAFAVADVVTTSWDVMIVAAVSLVLGLGMVVGTLHGYDDPIGVTRGRDRAMDAR